MIYINKRSDLNSGAMVADDGCDVKKRCLFMTKRKSGFMETIQWNGCGTTKCRRGRDGKKNGATTACTGLFDGIRCLLAIIQLGAGFHSVSVPRRLDVGRRVRAECEEDVVAGRHVSILRGEQQFVQDGGDGMTVDNNWNVSAEGRNETK